MPHGNIIPHRFVFLVFCIRKIELRHLSLENFFPFSLKVYKAHYCIVLFIDSSVETEHRGISVTKLGVYPAHLPLEFILLEA